MLQGQDWRIISKVLCHLYRNPAGLTVAELSLLLGQRPEVTAGYLVLLEQIGAFVGLFCDEAGAEWDEESDYIEFLAHSVQRWFVSTEEFSRVPIEFEVSELLTLAQLAKFSGDQSLAAKLAHSLEQSPAKAVLMNPQGPSQDTHLNSITDAILQEKEVHISIGISREKITQRRVVPLAVVHNLDTGFWYLIYRWRQGIHQLRLDKLMNLRTGKRVSGGLPAFDLNKYLGRSWGLMRGREEKVEALFRDEARVLAKAYARIRHRPDAVWEKYKDGRQRYSDIVAGVDEMLPWFRAFGGSVEVLRPKWVRERLLQEAEEIRAFYSSDAPTAQSG